MYSTASFTVVIFSASSSGTSMPKASSNAMTNSTWSSESAPRSSTNDAVGVTSASSTPSCSTIICFTRSSTLAIPVPPRLLIAVRADWVRLPQAGFACPTCAEYSRAKIVVLGPFVQIRDRRMRLRADCPEMGAPDNLPILDRATRKVNLLAHLSCPENPGHRRFPKLGNPPQDLDLRNLLNPRVSAEIVGIGTEVTIIFPFLFLFFLFFFAP